MPALWAESAAARAVSSRTMSAASGTKPLRQLRCIARTLLEQPRRCFGPEAIGVLRPAAARAQCPRLHKPTASAPTPAGRSSKRRLDRPRCRDRLLGAADRATYHEHAGAVVARLARGDDALLVAVGAAAEAQRRGRRRSRPSTACTASATSWPEQTMPSSPAAMRQLGEAHAPGRGRCRPPRCAARSRSSRLVSIVTATTLVFSAGGRLGVLHHRPPAAGVDRDDRRLAARGSPASPRRRCWGCRAA